MDAEIIQDFIEEAESYLPSVRGGILLGTQKFNSKDEINASIIHLHTIKGAAKLLGLNEISLTAEILEQDLKTLADSNAPLTEKFANDFLDKLVILEAQISKLSFEIDGFEIDTSEFIEESFANFQLDEFEKHSMPTDAFEVVEESVEVEDSFEDFEIDDEMLEIFAMEADDHIQNINKNLELLEDNANNREALLEIRRSSHTLKGSAGIVGLKTLSTLAHKVEDLLDYISDNEIESNEEIFHLLLFASDCISAVASNESSKELTEKITRTQVRFDELLERLQKGEESEIENKKAAQQNNNDVQKSKEFKIETPPNSEIHTSSIPNNNPVIRVSLDKLDDLVKLVGEMIFSRSVFEQRLSELEKQINEFHNSTRRLRHSTGKLETDFESGIFQNRTFNQNTYNSTTTNSMAYNNSSLKSNSENAEFDMLELDRYNEFNQTTRELIETTNDTLTINSEIEAVHNYLEILFDNQKHLIDEMQDKLLSLRMISFGTLSTRLQRTVRVTAEEEEKLVELSIEDESLEVDTQILDSLIDPLLHLLRNAVAHGIETPETRRLLGKDERGKISVRAYSEGTHIVLTISDDGCGISTAALKHKAVEMGSITKKQSNEMSEEDALSLIFLPGLTTAEEISQVSGRGVGMNIVKTNVERQKGMISIDSELQKGTTFTIRLPMALAVTRCLLVQANDYTYAFPLKLVKHISEIAPGNLEKAKQQGKLRLGDIDYSISHLNELMGLSVETTTTNQDIPLLLLETVKKPCALVVDKIIKPQEIIIKPLGKPLKDHHSFLGATLLGDGSVVPVLDLIYLLDEQTQIIEKYVTKPTPRKNERLTVMIVDDSPSVRHVNSILVKNNNWIPIIAKDGIEALEILNSSSELPDVVLTDVEMPGMDGYELLSLIKQEDKTRKLPVVMLTSRTSEKHRQKAYDLGVSDYLTKPYDDAKLIETIVRLSG